jgi:FMN phosphatase YigB (HAD superfamily)
MEGRLMMDTILFDLDGTLLHFSQREFIEIYSMALGKVFAKMGMDPGLSMKAIWTGTKAMALNDGGRSNADRFWAAFAGELQLTDSALNTVIEACNGFYANEFDALRSLLRPNDIAKRLVHTMAEKGYTVVLATNPMFPYIAVDTRLGWAGLGLGDFALVTHYENCSYCKPNPGYFQEILTKIQKTPEQCLMAGNNPVEDMCAGALGLETWLVTDCLENETGMDITGFRQGSLGELEAYLVSLPDIAGQKMAAAVR